MLESPRKQDRVEDKAAEELAALRAEVEATRRRAAFASEASMAILSAAHDVEQILERLTRVTVPEVADGCVVYLASPAGELERLAVAHKDPAKLGLLEAFLAREVAITGATSTVWQAHRKARPIHYPQVDDELLRQWAPNEQSRALLTALNIRSVVIAPMVAHGRSRGVLVVGTDADRAFGEADLELFTLLGQKVALAIDNATLYASERRSRLRTELLQSLTTKLARALTPEEVSLAIVDHATSVGASLGAIWTVDVEASCLRLASAAGRIAADDCRARPLALAAPTPIGRALTTGEPLFFGSEDEYRTAFPSDRILEWPAGLDRLAFVPLVVADRRLGVAVFGFDGESPREPDARGFLLLSSSYAAQALFRADLLQAERKAQREVSLLYDMLDRLNRATTLEEVFEPSLDAITVGLECDQASILLFDEAGVMRFRAWRGLSDSYRTAVEGHSPWPFGALDPIPIITPDIEADPSLAPYVPLFHSEGIAALAFVPLVHQRELLGKLMVYSRAPRVFSETNLRLANVIASQIAHAVARRISATQAENARVAAERANRLKDEFLAVVSHELRTPLSAIVGWAAILRDEPTPDPATQARGLDVILRNAKAQARLVEDILDVSRIITGKLVIDQSTASLLTVIGEALDAVRASAQAKEIELAVDHPDDPFTLGGDPDRLRQIVWNLLSNAIKFTPQGGRVEIRLQRQLGAIELAVADTGNGIAPEFLPHLFERFSQADTSTTRRKGGLGLGLAIVRHLVELHGGHVRVESAGVGRGSTFVVVLPVRALQPTETVDAEPAPASEAAPPALDPHQQPVLEGLRVLVVDDEDDAREILGEALTSYGAIVQTAASAEECLSVLPGFHPDVLVSDIAMPGEDGYALIRRLRTRSESAGIPAVALTAFARPEDVARAMRAGFQRHVAKPVEPRALARTVRDLARLARP
jgi:signal transduction histidine kinase